MSRYYIRKKVALTCAFAHTRGRLGRWRVAPLEQEEPDLVLRFGGSLVEQLGAQLYPSLTATVAELISNAWDADATNVWATIPFGESWEEDSEIVLLDNGNGMTRAIAQEAYLVVGYKRRLSRFGNHSEGGRLVHGRKGIGKLAAFGTAGVLECRTVRDGFQTAFRLDYDEIRKLSPAEDYKVEPLEVEPLTTPDGGLLESGTQIRLTRLKLKKAISQDQFLRSMSRRFAIDSTQMTVTINGNLAISRYDIDTEFRFPKDGTPGDDVHVADDGWAEETVDGKPVRWWIGFTAKPLGEDQQQGVSILANGKMAQRPFRFEKVQGTTGQLGQEYLVGEVVADWIDFGTDIEDDLIQSNRDQLQLEDARLVPLLEWGRRRLAWALRQRGELRTAKSITSLEENPALTELLEDFTPTERKRLLNVARAVARTPEIDDEGIASTMRSVVDAQSDRAVREMMERIEEEEDPFQEKMWGLVHEFGLIDARRNLSIIEARLQTIGKLKSAIASGAKEVPDLHQIVVADPWLLDPRWNLLDDEVDVATLGVNFEPEGDETGNIMDFLFGLAPHPPAPLDQVVLVEIKRGTDTKGNVRKADVNEVNKFHGYTLAVDEHYATGTERVTVRGLMIAQDYTPQADAVRRSLETAQGVHLTFRTWDRVIDDTERMHLGWLAVSQERAKPTS